MADTKTTLGRLGIIGAACMHLAACLTDPLLDEGLEPAETSVISGDAVILTPMVAHKVVLFLTAIGDDGYPMETPTNLTVIPASEMVAEDGLSSILTGRYTFPLVPPGDYVVTGIVDVDDNFVPVGEGAQPSAADLAGGYVDPTTGGLIVLSVGAGEVRDEVNVLFAGTVE